jgi:hypothetical protein
MTYRISCLFAPAVLVATWSGPIVAQEYSNGGKGAAGRKPAILTPVEAFGVHPPGLAPADARHWKPYVPYYAPLSPVASSTRWKPWSYHPLFPYFTPYYLGYCPHRLFNPRPRPYGSDGWGKGPMPEQPLPPEELETPLRYGGYTSVVDDDTTYWNMGGNGLVPYGADRPAAAGPPDLVDAIRSSRPRRGGHAHFHRAHSGHPPAIATPVEIEGEDEGGEDRGLDGSSPRRTMPAEPIPPGETAEQ